VASLDADHAQPVVAEAAADAGADHGLDQASSRPLAMIPTRRARRPSRRRI
jgi:hypothetical protein